VIQLILRRCTPILGIPPNPGSRLMAARSLSPMTLSAKGGQKKRSCKSAHDDLPKNDERFPLERIVMARQTSHWHLLYQASPDFSSR
jgi:hypothetical protein